jgi:hypothetical protein
VAQRLQRVVLRQRLRSRSKKVTAALSGGSMTMPDY